MEPNNQTSTTEPKGVTQDQLTSSPTPAPTPTSRQNPAVFSPIPTEEAGTPAVTVNTADPTVTPQSAPISRKDDQPSSSVSVAAEIASPEKPILGNANTQTQKPTTAEEFLSKDQKATGSFISKLFGKKKAVPPIPASGNNSATKTEAQIAQEAEKIYQQGLASIKDLISPSSFDISSRHINVSGIFTRSFFVYAYPRFLETNWLSPIVNLDSTIHISQFIYPISSAEIMKILKKKVAQIGSSIHMAQEKGNVRDPALETALEDAEQLRTDLQRGQEKFFQFGMYFTVFAENEEKLDASSKQIENMLGGKLVLTKRADIRGEHAFNSTLPLCIDEIEVMRNMNTSPLSTNFPFVSSDLTSDEGILYGLNRHNDSLIIFDRFKLPNANSVVFASSGAGKSYAVKLEILRLMMLGSDVIVIDPENEYEALSEVVGGTYLKVSLNSEQRINPFDIPQAFDDQDTKPGDLLRENVITLTGLMKLMLGEMTASEEALMDKALIETYAVRGITMDTEEPGNITPPTMEDFHSVLSGMKGAENLSERLQKFTSGTFSGIFNKPTNVDLNSGFVVFCIRDLEEALRPIATFIILNYIWNRVRSKLKKRVLVVDEAWSLMQHEDSAKFLYGLVKRARKYYLGITTITQDVEDFMGSKYGKPIVTNASMQLLLKQAPSAANTLKQVFDLTDGEKYLLLNSDVGQGLFFAGMKHVAIQVIASYSENQIVTTNPEEKLKQQAEKEKQFES